MSRGRAQVQAEDIARQHDENFPVAFLLAPRDVRADMRAIYAYCRVTDDIGDAGVATHDERLEALDAWEQGLVRAMDGHGDDPVLVAVAGVIRRRRLPIDQFTRLIEANRMDQRISRWESHEDLLHYCAHSATPVGRMVLGVLGIDDARRVGLSDATCEGLQLVNFWQDVRRDRSAGRVYLPAEDMARHGVDEATLDGTEATGAFRSLLRDEVAWARSLFDGGAALRREAPPPLRAAIGLFLAGGRAVADSIEAAGFDTLSARPTLGPWRKAGLAARAAAGIAWSSFTGA